MRRILVASVLACLFSIAIADRPARAGDYYGRYSYTYGDCYDCGYHRHRYSHDWDEPNYRSHRYYDRSRYSDRYDDGYSSYASSYSYRHCYPGEVKIEDGRGGWVWGVKTVCD